MKRGFPWDFVVLHAKGVHRKLSLLFIPLLFSYWLLKGGFFSSVNLIECLRWSYRSMDGKAAAAAKGFLSPRELRIWCMDFATDLWMLHPQPLGAKCIIPTRSLILTPFPKHQNFRLHFLLFALARNAQSTVAASPGRRLENRAYSKEQNLLKILSGSDKMLRFFSHTNTGNTILPSFSPSASILLCLLLRAKKYHYFGGLG